MTRVTKASGAPLRLPCDRISPAMQVHRSEKTPQSQHKGQGDEEAGRRTRDGTHYSRRRGPPPRAPLQSCQRARRYPSILTSLHHGMAVLDCWTPVLEQTQRAWRLPDRRHCLAAGGWRPRLAGGGTADGLGLCCVLRLLLR